MLFYASGLLHAQLILFGTPTHHLSCLFNSYFFRHALLTSTLTLGDSQCFSEFYCPLLPSITSLATFLL